MDEILSSVVRLLNEVVLPNLKTVHAGQTQQIETTHRVERAIEDLRIRLESQFAELTVQLTACRAELAATQALLKAAGTAQTPTFTKAPTLVH